MGIFPNNEAVVRLVGMVLIEQHEEWQLGCRYLSEHSLALLQAPVTVTAAQTASPETGHLFEVA